MRVKYITPWENSNGDDGPLGTPIIITFDSGEYAYVWVEPDRTVNRPVHLLELSGSEAEPIEAPEALAKIAKEAALAGYSDHLMDVARPVGETT